MTHARLLILSSLMLAGSQPVAAAPPAPAPGCYLEPAQRAAWWQQGQPVQFRLAGGKLTDEVTAITGLITDVAGKEVARVTVARNDLTTTGWTWQPQAPGYYDVAFSAVAGNGASTALTRSFTVKAPTHAVRSFERTTQGLAVMARPAAAPAVTVGQFGMGCYDATPEQLFLAQLIGFDLVRLTIPWGASFTNLKAAIEPVQGEFHWDRMDAAVDLFAKAGFLINAQFLYTPLWASPHPEKRKVNICTIEGTTYAPKKMRDFGNFVEMTVARYQDRVHLWEIWNEPSVPGGSVFWADTTENFCALLQTGYAAVKKVQPGAQVWLGGLGPRAPYHSFYNKLLGLGGANYFDVLSLHGSFNSPADHFRAIESAHAVAPKPAIQGEWHAVLQGNMQSEPVLSEPALSLKMMKDLLYQLKHGVSRIILFEMENLSEKETLGFCRDQKWFTHSSGLFRRQPQLEPRHPAVVLANFLNLTGRQAACVKEFQLAATAVALELTSANGPLVAFWSETTPPTRAQIAAIATHASTLRDWEGKTIPLADMAALAPNQLYYLTAPNTEATAKAAPTERLVAPGSLKRAMRQVPQAACRHGRLFEEVPGPAVIPDSAWITADWKMTRLSKPERDPAFSVRAAVGAHAEGIDVVVEVQDDLHCQNETRPLWWHGDSLQLAFDCEGNGLAGGNTEILCALTATGPVAWKVLAADPKGDIPRQWSPAEAPAQHVRQAITRHGKLTRYQLRCPWSELYPLVYDANKPLRLSLAVNNNNGGGRMQCLEWGGGITQDKDPSAYGLLKVLPPP